MWSIVDVKLRSQLLKHFQKCASSSSFWFPSWSWFGQMKTAPQSSANSMSARCSEFLLLIPFLIIATICFINNNHLHCNFLDVIASPSSYPCQWVGQWLIFSDLGIALASPSFASLLNINIFATRAFQTYRAAVQLGNDGRPDWRWLFIWWSWWFNRNTRIEYSFLRYW